MNSWMYVLCAVVIGVGVAFQPPINAAMARSLGSPFLSTVISISVSVIFATVLWASWGRGGGDIGQLRALPWWVYIGGLLGVIFVAGSIVVAPVLGVAFFFVCVVAGQLLGSTLIDHFGAFGLESKPFNAMKLAGLTLVVIGASLVQRSA